MRKVLSNNEEVAHYWANKVQEEGRAHSMFFEDDTIYSYGEHFPIAKHHDNLILFTNRSYSVSTSKHIGYTRYAIESGTRIIYCYNPAWPADPENLSSAINEIEYNLKKAIKARQRRFDYISAAESAHYDLLKLIKVFKIKGWKVPKYDFNAPEAITAMQAERDKKAAAKRKRAAAKQAKQDKLDMVEFLEDVEAWRNKKVHASGVKHRRFIHQMPDVCRVNGDKVESMRSCSVPIKEAKILLRCIKQGIPIKGQTIGHYTVISCTDEKLVIGCHEFMRSEIDSLMIALEV